MQQCTATTKADLKFDHGLENDQIQEGDTFSQTSLCRLQFTVTLNDFCLSAWRNLDLKVSPLRSKYICSLNDFQIWGTSIILVHKAFAIGVCRSYHFRCSFKWGETIEEPKGALLLVFGGVSTLSCIAPLTRYLEQPQRWSHNGL